VILALTKAFLEESQSYHKSLREEIPNGTYKRTDLKQKLLDSLAYVSSHADKEIRWEP
jgi:hypothetical protein